MSVDETLMCSFQVKFDGHRSLSINCELLLFTTLNDLYLYYMYPHCIYRGSSSRQNIFIYMAQYKGADIEKFAPAINFYVSIRTQILSLIIVLPGCQTNDSLFSVKTTHTSLLQISKYDDMQYGLNKEKHDVARPISQVVGSFHSNSTGYIYLLQILKPADKKKLGFGTLSGQGRPLTPPRNAGQQQKGKK